MTYRRFQLSKTPAGRATLATVATEQPSEGPIVASVATVASRVETNAAFEERVRQTRDDPAPAAIVATEQPPVAPVVANVATVADVESKNAGFEERVPQTKRLPGPATVATVATELSPELQTVANVTTVADNGAFEERAAIVEYDAGVPREWAEGFARLDVASPPTGFDNGRWRQIIDDGGRFLDRWALAADGLGWSATDVFGLSTSAPSARYEGMGLVALIGGGEVIAVGKTSATIRRPEGSCLTYYLRRPRPDAVPAWDLVSDG